MSFLKVHDLSHFSLLKVNNGHFENVYERENFCYEQKKAFVFPFLTVKKLFKVAV